MLTLAGAGIWLLSFLIAATGVALRAMAVYALAARLFFYSSLVGLLGIYLLAVATLWFVGLYVRKFVRERRR